MTGLGATVTSPEYPPSAFNEDDDEDDEENEDDAAQNYGNNIYRL